MGGMDMSGRLSCIVGLDNQCSLQQQAARYECNAGLLTRVHAAPDIESDVSAVVSTLWAAACAQISTDFISRRLDATSVNNHHRKIALEIDSLQLGAAVPP